MKFRINIDTERCKGCCYCVIFCPKSVLKMSKEFNQKGHHFAVVEVPDECIGCAQCAQICPDSAIEIEREDDE